MRPELSIYEVGLRDGLQNEPGFVPTASKARLFAAHVAAGVRRVEAASFVRPTAVPQMADAAEVVAHVNARADVRASALVINEKGYARARAAGVREIAVVVVVSETLAARNSRMKW